MNYVLVGYGRMGRAIEIAANARGHTLVGRFDTKPGDGVEAAQGLPERMENVDVAFEFTVAEAAEENLLRLITADVAVVCGTTGWCPSPALDRALAGVSRGVVIAPNFSIGVNLFYRLVREATQLYRIDASYHPYVLEWHHRGKRDAPSGTARRLAEVLGEVLPGKSAEVPVASLRAGYEPGAHTVGFDGEHDSITIRHRARDRAAFALGAVLAGEWALNQCGLQDFDGVLDALLENATVGKEGDEE